jgi:hypothetical protein
MNRYLLKKEDLFDYNIWINFLKNEIDGIDYENDYENDNDNDIYYLNIFKKNGKTKEHLLDMYYKHYFNAFEESEFLKSIICDLYINYDDFEIPLINEYINNDTMKFIMKYLLKRYDIKLQDKKYEYLKLLEIYDLENRDIKFLCNLILISNYLGIESLTEIISKIIANFIEDNIDDPDKIRTEFEIDDDLTNEEKEKIKNENSFINENIDDY